MTRAAFFAAFLLVAPVISLPVINPTTQDDTKVMTCIAEVISNTVAKPKPLSISQECLETLQGDERIRSILRHQNLLRELQEIAFQDPSEDTHNEKPTASLAELEAEKSFQSKQDVLKEEERNSLEEREPRSQDVDPDDEKENIAGFEGNEVDEMEGLPWSDTMDNHISDIREDDVLKQTQQEVEEVAGTEESEDEKEHVFKESQEERKEEEVDKIREQIEKEEEEEEEEEEEKDEEEEKERNASEEEHPTTSDNVDDQREDDNQDDDKNISEDTDKYHSVKSAGHHFLDGTRQDDDSPPDSNSKSEEMEKKPFQDVEDAKRWNKMDELAKQLTTTKRAEENESDEDPDRSMKMAVKSHDTRDLHSSPEDEARRLQKHHSKEDSEQGFPLLPIPEEKKDEEGSANRRTEEQELESLAAIEAELEKVARKLHALRRG
ncbi:PREDICTED: chromogranin-A isoform X2 [Thamnophis sirtalis]|uniref:Chromogranin-A n=1 Tax=Thamnophis sirtalis TaxID=35019 RepID=A0A6I9YEH9_9SAUR|nr:PREDICTED: chromogranin-A isoform X2 [Thamnophis sirtalis]